MIEVVTPVVLALAVLSVLAVGWFILPFGLRRLAEIRLARLCKAHKVIVLSYDDGPGPALTQRLGWWTIDSTDTKNSEDRRRIDEIAQRGGGVVLMHDFDGPAHLDDGMSHADYVISLTGQIIEFAEKNGYRLMRLGDVLHMAQSRVQRGA